MRKMFYFIMLLFLQAAYAGDVIPAASDQAPDGQYITVHSSIRLNKLDNYLVGFKRRNKNCQLRWTSSNGQDVYNHVIEAGSILNVTESEAFHSFSEYAGRYRYIKEPNRHNLSLENGDSKYTFNCVIEKKGNCGNCAKNVMNVRDIEKLTRGIMTFHQ
jgi:hypothetical protein